MKTHSPITDLSDTLMLAVAFMGITFFSLGAGILNSYTLNGLPWLIVGIVSSFIGNTLLIFTTFFVYKLVTQTIGTTKNLKK